MASDVVSLLGQVVAGLEARQLNRELAAQMTMAVVQFCETESGMWRRLNRNQQRKLLQLLRRFAAAAVQLSSRLTDADGAAPSTALHSQVCATCMALPAGLNAMHALDVDAEQQLQLCGAAALVLRAGSSCAAASANYWHGQLATITAVALLHPGSNAAAATAAAATLASTVVRPEALLPWMATAATAFDAAWRQRSTAASIHIGHFVTLAGVVLTAARYAEHRRALAANPALARPITAVLLRHCLPDLAGTAAAAGGLCGADLQKLAWLAPGVADPCMAVAAESYAQHLEDAAEAVRQAAGIVQLLPDPQPGGLDGKLLKHYVHATSLLGMLGYGMAASPDGGEQAGDAATGGTGSSSSSPSSHASRPMHLRAAAGPLLRALPRVLAVIQAAGAEGSAVLQPVAGSSSGGSEAAVCAVNRHNLACLMTTLSGALALLDSLRCYVAAPAEFHLWLDAAEAGVRLQPTLTRLHRLSEPGGQPSVAEAAQRLAGMLARAVWGNPQSLLVPLGDLEDEAAAAQRASLGNRLWQLHSTSCRWLHSMLAERRAGGGREAAFWLADGGRLWAALLFSLNLIFLRACDTMGVCSDAPPGPTAAAQQAALGAAHWEAVRGLAAAAEPDGGFAIANGDEFTVLLRAYHRMATTCPFLATPTFFHPYLQAVRGATAHITFSSAAEVMVAAARHPRVAMAALLSGVAQMTLHDAAKFAALPDLTDAGIEQIESLLPQLEGVLLCLEQGALEASHSRTGRSNSGDSSGQDGSGQDGSALAGSSSQGAASPNAHDVHIPLPPSLGDLLEVAADLMRADREAHAPHAAEGSSASLSSRAQALQRRLSSAFNAAQHLAFFYDMPQQAAAARMAAAQAAAARSCAYLCCTNLASEGGPGSRQGTGSAKCSACRAVRYCGTACSHADWKAGHRRTCKALGAARQQEGRPPRTADAGAEEGRWQGSGLVLFGIQM